MGRLQRKKTSGKPKKKKQTPSAQEAVKKDNAIAARKPLAIVASSKDAVRRGVESQKKSAASSKPTSELKFWTKGTQFLREVKVELKKVTWPSRKQTMGSTLVVIILVMIISLFLGVVDVGLSGIIRLVLQ
jgi:preprotein translocase subunit SecE